MPSRHPHLMTDLRVVFLADGTVDIALDRGSPDTVSGLDNLAQALTLRLLTEEGELVGLGHPRYGSQVRALVGEPLDRANLELLRRRVRQCLRRDPRVAEVVKVTVTPRAATPGVVDVDAVVTAVSGEALAVSLVADLG